MLFFAYINPNYQCVLNSGLTRIKKIRQIHDTEHRKKYTLRLLWRFEGHFQTTDILQGARLSTLSQSIKITIRKLSELKKLKPPLGE